MSKDEHIREALAFLRSRDVQDNVHRLGSAGAADVLCAMQKLEHALKAEPPVVETLGLCAPSYRPEIPKGTPVCGKAALSSPHDGTSPGAITTGPSC